MSKYNLHDLFEGMSDKEFADAQEKERLEDHPEKDKIKAIQALLAKEKINEGDLFSSKFDRPHLKDIIRDLNEQPIMDMAVRRAYKFLVSLLDNEDKREMGLNEDKKELPDSIKKAEQDQIEKDARKSRGDIKELDMEASNRIEGLLNIPMKKKFLDVGMDLIQDLLEEDPFEIDDVIDHLASELGKYYDNFLGAGERLNSIEIDENGDKDDYKNEIAEDADVDVDMVKATVAKANNQITNPASFADFIIDVINQIREKEQEGIFNNNNIKQAIAFLEKAQGADGKELDTMGENHAMQGVEAELESGEIGNMDAFTEELKEAVAEEESVADYLMDYYRNPNKPEETMVDEKIVGEYYKTHPDWDLIWGKSYKDGLEDFQEFFDANYSYMFDDAKIDEDKALKEHFKRFMFKNYQ